MRLKRSKNLTQNRFASLTFLPPRLLGRAVIFIASTPRSGSTLVEQILASHPDVTGANEVDVAEHVLHAVPCAPNRPYPANLCALTADDWTRLGNRYLEQTARWRERTRLFTDKSLGNWSRVGPILSMLPGARIIIVRRDPVETCFSCFRQYFFRGAPFSYNLNDLADYYGSFDRMRRFWLTRFPDRVLDFRYEDLIVDPERATRRLLHFCGLPFDAACLAFHRTSRTVTSDASAAQVRQSLDRNTARADRYGSALDPLRRRLHELGCLLPAD